MKKVYYIFFGILLSSFITIQISAQNADTYQLADPDNLSPLFLGSLIAENQIYYGADPGNSSDNPVIVFVHGFIDLANLWFAPGNEMYERAYDNHYRSAFVAMTRGGGMWENGDMLADMLEEITDHYGVDDVVIVAHSNGGKASEVAMFYHGKKDLVDRVISLGTPFHGTELADLSQTFWFRWLVDFVGLGDGAATSTTYYMGDVARPYLDNLSNNQPEKFFNFGAWGYNSGSTVFAPAMYTTGLILNANGSAWYNGGNDGVTPYWSSTRPGGLQVWNPGYGNPVSAHDHIDVTYDFACWDEMEPYFTAPLGNLVPKTEANLANRVVRGDGQYLSSEAGQTEFVIENGATDIIVSILHQSAEDQFAIYNEAGELIENEATPIKSQFNYFATNFSFDQLSAGRYRIQSNSKFGAVINYENGIHLIAQKENGQNGAAYQVGETVEINLTVKTPNTSNFANEVVAFISKKDIPTATNFKAGTMEAEVQIFDLKSLENNQFQLSLDGLDEGMYNVMIMANGDNFAKSLVTGFAVKANKNTLPIEQGNLEMKLAPNPVQDQLTININELKTAEAQLSIFDVYGRLVYETTITNTSNTLQISDILSENGTYYLRIADGTQQVVQSFMKF